MATNQWGQNYSGSDDFRGYLAGNAGRMVGGGLKNGLTYGQLLDFVGNDGGVDWNSVMAHGYDPYVAGMVGGVYNAWANARSGPGNGGGTNRQNEYVGQGSGGSGGSGSSYNAAKAAEEERQRQERVKYYDDQIRGINSSIGDLDAALRNRYDNIEGSYNTYKNEQQSNYDQQKNSYDTGSRNNTKALVTNRNDITSNAAAGLRGLLRILGAHGAGGSSVALYDAPSVVKRQADIQYNNADKTFAENQQNLDTNWNNFLIGHENDKKKLEDWKTSQRRSAEQAIEEKRVSLLKELQDAYINRSQNGAGPGDNLNQITDRMVAANRKIVDLGAYTPTQYTGTSAVYTAPELSTYNANQANLTTSVSDNGGPTSTLTVLRELNRKKQDNQLFGTEA